ncbi:hypothetical protein [Rossellomorea sp. RS05]|uniref:hypothetical protein n=1 Tax=Rossellomorea sp. RS05 TaxID=3149166 RepID=UPI003221F022
MMKEILLPFVLHQIPSSAKHLNRIMGRLPHVSMQEVDKDIIGDNDIYLPKLTTKKEMKHFTSPVLIIAGQKRFFS